MSAEIRRVHLKGKKFVGLTEEVVIQEVTADV
ncbi:hypothetical protein JOC55_005625 [Paenibacillus sacheonensis]|nr:hypothetical protein [Paenibacillus sacheonensis]